MKWNAVQWIAFFRENEDYGIIIVCVFKMTYLLS